MLLAHQVEGILAHQHLLERADEAASLDLGLGQHAVAKGHPLSMNGRLDHHGGVAEDGPLIDVGGIDVELAEPGLPVPSRGVVQQGMPGQIVRRAQRFGAGQQQGRADGDQVFGMQFVTTQSGPVATAIVDGHVHVIGERSLVHVDGLDPHVDIGVTLAEFDQPGHQPLDGKARLQADGERPFGTARQQLVGRFRNGGKDILDIEKIALPLLGQQQGAILAAEQLDAKILLQRLDLVTDGSLSHKQLFCCAGKA